MKLQFPNTPKSILPVLKREMEKFGATVHFETETSGHVDSIAGKLGFHHDGHTLTISVLEDAGHFAPNLLIGGIKQTVSEACELLRLGEAHA